MPHTPFKMRPDQVFSKIQDDWFKAVSVGNIKAVQELIEQGFPVSHQDEIGWNALMHAIWEDRGDLFELCLPLTKLTQCDKDGWNALIVSIEGGYQTYTQRLSELIDPNVTDFYGYNALMHAITNVNQQVVQWLLPKTDLLHCAKGGRTALMLAAENGLEMVRLIIPHCDEAMILAKTTAETGGLTAMDLSKEDPEVAAFLKAVLLSRRENQELEGSVKSKPVNSKVGARL